MEKLNEVTERDEAFRNVYNAWVERYPNSKPLTNANIFGLLNDYANDTEYIISAINRLPDKKSNGNDTDFRLLQLFCNRTVGGNKKKIRRDQVIQIGYEEDNNGNLTSYGQHRKIMNSEWKLPTIEGFDPRNSKHLEIQFDYLFKTGQIGEEEYRHGMVGINIMTGKINLEDKLHVIMEVSEDDSIPF